jgi:hypothetical protein
MLARYQSQHSAYERARPQWSMSCVAALIMEKRALRNGAVIVPPAKRSARTRGKRGRRRWRKRRVEDTSHLCMR